MVLFAGISAAVGIDITYQGVVLPYKSLALSVGYRKPLDNGCCFEAGLTFDKVTNKTTLYASISASYDDEITGKLKSTGLSPSDLSLVGNWTVKFGYCEVNIGVTSVSGEIGVFYEKENHFPHGRSGNSPGVGPAASSIAKLINAKHLSQSEVNAACGEFLRRAMEGANLTSQERNVVSLVTSPNVVLPEPKVVTERIAVVIENMGGKSLLSQMARKVANGEQLTQSEFEELIKFCASSGPEFCVNRSEHSTVATEAEESSWSLTALWNWLTGSGRQAEHVQERIPVGLYN